MLSMVLEMLPTKFWRVNIKLCENLHLVGTVYCKSCGTSVTATHTSTLDVQCLSYCNHSRHYGANLMSVMLTRRSGPLLTEADAYETFHSVINHGRTYVGAVTTRVLCRFLITDVWMDLRVYCCVIRWIDERRRSSEDADKACFAGD
jgi:hypothetical protein